MKGIKISKGKELTKNKKLSFFNKPKYVYIPLVSGNDKDITVTVKKGEYVYKGSIVGKRKGKFRLPIYSSVSGTVVDFEEKYYLDGDKVKCVVIENDFKEKIEEKQYVRDSINHYTKKEFIKIIQDRGIVGMGGSGFPTYIKYDSENEIKTLIVNAVECEPYVTADIMLIREKSEEILDAIDAIMEINGIKECFIALKKDNKIIKKFENYIGTYPRIKIVTVPNIYPAGWERNLVEYITKEKYDVLPIEKGIVVNNVTTIYAIYQALRTNKPLIERIVTFTGDMFKKTQNVYVKIGTSVKDIIESMEGYKRNKDVIFVAGGPMMGKSIPSDDLIVTPNLNCVIAFKNKDNDDAIECLRCGKCVSHCPAKLSPVLIKDSLNSKKELENLKVNKCIECGLCSYVCPSKIKVREYVKQAKEIVKE